MLVGIPLLSGQYVQVLMITYITILFVVNFRTLLCYSTRRGRLVSSHSAWDASDIEIDPCIWHILSWRFCHKNISSTILPIALIQGEQLSVNGERIYAKYP